MKKLLFLLIMVVSLFSFTNVSAEEITTKTLSPEVEAKVFDYFINMCYNIFSKQKQISWRIIMKYTVEKKEGKLFINFTVKNEEWETFVQKAYEQNKGKKCH